MSMKHKSGCLTTTLNPIGGIDVNLTKLSGMDVSLTRLGGMEVTLAPVCFTDLKTPYLEIEPTVLWVYPDLDNTNDVYSNTRWNVH